jgi:uncharacterized membrane protein YbhN (UPF0104 family)
MRRGCVMAKSQTVPEAQGAPQDRGSGWRVRLDPRTWWNTDVRVFSSASDAKRSRRPTDLILLLLAIPVVITMTALAPGPTATDTEVSKLIDSLPGLFGWFWEISYDLLFFWALFLLLAAIIGHGRKRMLRDQILAGAVACALALIVGKIAGTDWSAAIDAIGSSHPPAVYPAMRLAICVAFIVTASPHLSRPLRYAGRWVLGIGAIAGVALGVALPLGVLAGFTIGVGAGAIVHLIFGSPAGRLTVKQVRASLAGMGIETTRIDEVALRTSGVELAQAQTVDERSLLVKIYGRDAWDGQLLASIWSSLWRRGETPRLGASRRVQVEHEAFITLLAERGGVPVAPVVAAGMTDQRDAVLALEIKGRPISTLEPRVLDGPAVARFWEALEKLHSLGFAHGAIDGYRLILAPDGSAILADFADASAPARPSEMVADRAQMLITMALLVGHAAAVDQATAALGTDGLAEVLPFLQPAIVDRETRRILRDKEWDLDDLRKLAADKAGVEDPELEKLRRVTWGSILMLVVIGLVGYAIISAIAQVGLQSLVDEFKSADDIWLFSSLVLSPFVGVPQAISTMGASIRSVRFGPVLALEYAIQFIALAVPSSAARVALEVRFFERNGVAATSAIAIGLIDSVCGFVVEMILILIITISGLASLDLSSAASGSTSATSFSGKLLVLFLVLIVLAAVVALAFPKFRSIVRSKAADFGEALRVLRSPSKVAMIFAGNLVAQVLLAIILGFSLRAFGGSATLAELILVNTLVSLFAGFMPVPGGMGVAEAGYTAGLVALGVPHSAALSTAIAFRMATYYLPPIWGSFAMKWLRTHSYV